MTDAGNLYGVTVIANLLTISPRHVRRLVKDGVLPQEENGQFDLIKTVQAYIRYLDKGDKKEELADAQLRKVIADADKAELDLAMAKGAVVAVEEVTQVWAKACGELRSALLSLPSKMGPMVRLAKTDAEAQSALETTIHEALGALSSSQVGDEPDPRGDNVGAGDTPAAAKIKDQRVGGRKTAPKRGGKRGAGKVADKSG